MSNQNSAREHQSAQEPHPYITAHIAKGAFRFFLPMFAAYWAEAREAAVPGSPNAVIWPNYEHLLRACQDILYHAPMHPNEAKQFPAEKRYVASLERLATTLSRIFPNGFMELESYIPTKQDYHWRRSRGLVRYHRVKPRRRRTRRKR